MCNASLKWYGYIIILGIIEHVENNLVSYLLGANEVYKTKED